MAEIVGVLGVSHNPLMWSLLQDSVPDDLERVASNFDRLRLWVSDLDPDVILLVASDHLHMLLTSNMPAFMIGKAERMRAVHPNEVRTFGMEQTEVIGDSELAAALLGHSSLTPDFDFAFSDEPWLDHSFMVPLFFLTPALEVPVVPVFTNATAPPMPTAARFAQLGDHLREGVESIPLQRRVLVVASGHLSHELGGPRQFLGSSADNDFDTEAVSWMGTGDLGAAVAGCSFERLGLAGNLTYQFLNFITSLAVAQGAPASFSEATATRFGNLPFFQWEDA